MVEALIQRAGQGRIVQAGGMTLEYLAESDRSNDGMGIYLLTLAPQSPGAGPHYHQRMTETFHVHSGILSMMVDNKPVEAKAGDFVLIPPTVPHAFAIVAMRPLRLRSALRWHCIAKVSSRAWLRYQPRAAWAITTRC